MVDFRFIAEKYIFGRHGYRHPPYEPLVKKALLKIKGDLFVDVGANEGRYCIMLRKNFSNIIAFEPNIMFDPPCNLLSRVALSNHFGEAMFYLNSSNGSSNTLIEKFRYNPGYDRNMAVRQVFTTQRKVLVKTSTYDMMIGNMADLVKIDVEGAEFLVLDGMKLSLKNAMVKNVLVELHDVDKEQDLLDLFSKYSLKATKIDDHPHWLGSLS